jgi:hypothetical protein
MARMLNLLFGRRDRSTSFRQSLQIGAQQAQGPATGPGGIGSPMGLLLALTKAS